MENNRKRDSGATPADGDERRGEVFNYKPADPARLAYLISVAKGEAAANDQESEALARIAEGRGGPVELPKVQQSEGRKFIAQLNARLHSLRHRYGFNIENRVTEDNGQKLSVYWIVLDESGGPKMSPVRMAEVKTGKPKAPANAEERKPAAARPDGFRRPFSYSPKYSPVRVPPTLPGASPKPSQPVQASMFDVTKSAVGL